MDFRKTETNLFLIFVRAEGGVGEEPARALLSDFLVRAMDKISYKC